MKRNFGIFLICALLNACASSPDADHYYLNPDQYARCNELKHRIISMPATNDSIVAAQRNGEMDTLNRSYREDGC